MDRHCNQVFSTRKSLGEIAIDTALFKRNLVAFKANIPSLYSAVLPKQTARYALVQHPDTLSFDYISFQSQELMYTANGHASESDKVTSFLNAPSSVTMSQDHNTTLPKTSPLVVLGLGIGWHLPQLVASQQFDTIVIYEPESEFLALSLYVIDWCSMFEYCQSHGVKLFIQVGQDGQSIQKDMLELKQHYQFHTFAMYKHHHRPMFNAVMAAVSTDSFSAMEELKLDAVAKVASATVLPLWSDANAYSWQALGKDDALFQQNLAQLETYFPDLYAVFSEYEPTYWTPVAKCDEGASERVINLANQTSHSYLYQTDALTHHRQAEAYIQYPSKESLSIRYDKPKHHHYIQHTFTRNANKLLENIEEGDSQLPEKLSCMLLFGFGLGHALPFFIEQRKIQHIIVCESQLDFFYGSLFVLDWQTILQQCIDQDIRLYLNIGQDDSQLLDDISSQSQKIGVHLMATTYIYKPYYYQPLERLFIELREHLVAQIAMHENIDHVMYGVQHTYGALTRQVPFLIKDSHAKMNNALRDLPIFIIGNGPSLDEGIAYLQELQDQAIIVSCGTALKALIDHNIVPDYHAEIEQNRACYDWIGLSTTPQQRQQITLISCNGIHPDVIDLFPKTQLITKSGETSTFTFFGDKQTSLFAVANYAFPTVSNFAVNFFLESGFKNMYLFGLDLGFKDPNQAHSKHSAYYVAGKSKYEPEQSATQMHTLPGNFCPVVQTKFEFKLAHRQLEQTLSHYQNVEVYNLSDGALIRGSVPLHYEDMLLLSIDKAALKARYEHEFFSHAYHYALIDKYESMIRHPDTVVDIDALKISDHVINEYDDIVALCELLQDKLLGIYSRNDTYVFFIFRVFVATLSAILMKNHQVFIEPEQYKKLSYLWDEALEGIKTMMTEQHQFELDYSIADIHARSHQRLIHQSENKQLLICDAAIESDVETPPAFLTLSCYVEKMAWTQHISDTHEQHSHILLHAHTEQFNDLDAFNDWIALLAQQHPHSKLTIIYRCADIDRLVIPDNVNIVIIPTYTAHHEKPEYTLEYVYRYIHLVLFNQHFGNVILFKYYQVDGDEVVFPDEIMTSQIQHIYTTSMIVMFTRQKLDEKELIATNGCRLTKYRKKINADLFTQLRNVDAKYSSQYQVVDLES